jgi:aminoglycoside phosphotransferase (APT) family kinase protein
MGPEQEEHERAMYAHWKVTALPSQLDVLTLNGIRGFALARLRGNVAELAAVCQVWGSSLATLHAIPTQHSAPPFAPRPWLLNPANLMPSRRGAANGPGYRTVLDAYGSNRDLRAAVREVEERWTEQHWIHGDLSAINVLVERRPALRVGFAGLESVGLGDPAWDLASCVDTITWLSPRWHAVPQQLVDYFLLGYRRAGGPARLYPAMQAVRALTTALRVGDSLHCSSSKENTPAELAAWLDRAQAYADRVGYLMAVA